MKRLVSFLLAGLAIVLFLALTGCQDRPVDRSYTPPTDSQPQ